MAELDEIFAESRDKAQQASNIAQLWANGDTTTLITTEGDDLPSLARFMNQNLKTGEEVIDLVDSDVNVSFDEFNSFIYFRGINNTVARTINFPELAKIFYVENSGSDVITVAIGTAETDLAPGDIAILYCNGTANNLSNITEEIKNAVGAVQNNNNAADDPEVTDDSDAGYAIFSQWINQNTGKIYICLDATVGAAVWVLTNLAISDLGALATSDNAAEVPYTGTLDGTNVKDALDELDSEKTTTQQATDIAVSNAITFAIALG